MKKAKKYIVALVVVIAALLFMGAVIPNAAETARLEALEQEAAQDVANGTVFFDQNVVEVEGMTPEDGGHYMLPAGRYEVLYKDGSTAAITVSGGSWWVEYVNQN